MMVATAVYGDDGSIVGYVSHGQMFSVVKKSDDVWDLIIEPSEDLSPEKLGENNE